MRLIANFFLLGAVASLLTGCARVTATTSLHSDGSYDRHVVFVVTKMNGMAPGDASVKGPQKPEDFFKLPTASAGNKVAKAEDKEGINITLDRTALSGSAPVQDITLLTDKGQPLATSSVSVTKLPDGKLEYVETLHWVAAKEPTPDFAASGLRANVKQALPESYRTTEIIDALTTRIAMNVLHAVAGPPNPAFFDVISNRDMAIRKITANMFEPNIQSIQEIAKGISEADARAAARTFSNILNLDSFDADKAKEGPEGAKPNSQTNSMTPLLFEVSFSGRVVETDGIIDPVTGHVYWSLYPFAVQPEDVRLRAVIQP